MRVIASAIAIVGITVTANASFRGNRMTTYNMEQHEQQPALSHASMYQIEEEGTGRSQTDNTKNQISVGISFEENTVSPAGDDQVDVGITYETDAPMPVKTDEPADDDETTMPMDDDDMTTTGPMDDDEVTTTAPDDADADDDEVMDDAADAEAYILSESGRNLQAEVNGVRPPVPRPSGLRPRPIAPLPVLPGVIVFDVNTDDDDDDEIITTEAPIDVTTEPIDDDEVTVEPIDDEETSVGPTEEIPTVLPGGPFLPIIDIIGRPSRPPVMRPRPSTTSPPVTEAPIVVVGDPVVVVIEEPVAQQPTIEEPAPQDPPTDGVQSPSETSEDKSFIQFLPSWLRSSEESSEA